MVVFVHYLWITPRHKFSVLFWGFSNIDDWNTRLNNLALHQWHWIVVYIAIVVWWLCSRLRRRSPMNGVCALSCGMCRLRLLLWNCFAVVCSSLFPCGAHFPVTRICHHCCCCCLGKNCAESGICSLFTFGHLRLQQKQKMWRRVWWRFKKQSRAQDFAILLLLTTILQLIIKLFWRRDKKRFWLFSSCSDHYTLIQR